MGPALVCAVVVTFHPDAEVLANLSALCTQVGRTVVVDNGSTAAELSVLREGCASACGAELNCELVELGENLGIASALNVGVRRAQELAYGWVLLLDQDSCVPAGFVQTMLEGFCASAWGDRLAILAPCYVDARLEAPIPANLVQEGLEAAMTSGSLMRTSLFARLGYFVDELFIDGVDYEFSLRVRAAGLVIAECPGAVLRHSPGEPRVVRWLGRRLYQTANYAAIRRYYQERNKIWISLRYFRRFPVFCAKLFLFSAKDLVKILVAEQGSGKKARYFLRGVWDGIRGRMGRLE